MTTPQTPQTPPPLTPEQAEKLTRDQYFHVLPNLAVRDHPDLWKAVIDLLAQRGVSREDALTRIRFAFTGSTNGPLPPGVD